MLPVTICKRDSANYSACLKNALEEAWPRFHPGLPEFDFPPLKPLFYEYEKFKFNLDEVYAEIIISNVTINDFSKARFFYVRAHFLDDVFRLEIDTLLPKVFVKGGISIDGTLNVFKIIEKGYFNFTADDARATWELIGHVINDTRIIEHFRIIPSIKNVNVNFESLFEQNKDFNNVVLTFINEFWPTLYRIILPLASDTWDHWFTTFPNKLFSKILFSKIFP